MSITKDGYQNYLLARSMSPNTVSSYCSGINHLAKHSGLELWSITDVEQLNKLLEDYGSKGQFADLGNYGAAAARIGLRHWRDYVSNETSGVVATAQPATYLLLWEPEFYQGGDNARGTGRENIHCPCRSTKPQPGDSIYLIRHDVTPRGIVAKGIVTKGSFDDDDLHDPSNTLRYIECNIEEARLDCTSGLLPTVLLELLAQNEFQWKIQNSGVSIPFELAEQIDHAWEMGYGVHSLAQCARWYQAQPDMFDNWKPRYRSRIETIEAIKSAHQKLDDATLDWLWREGTNGVCTVSPGHLSNTEYEQNIPLLRELTTLILQDPGRITYDQIFVRWNNARAAGSFRQNYPAVIHRVFAAADPTHYTTLVNIRHCRDLLGHFARDFELNAPDSKDWLELNQSIKQTMTQAGVTLDPLDNNIFTWMLFEALNTPSAEATSNPSSILQSEPEELIMVGEAPLNQILFGPPGTGKTYHTIDKALTILEPALLTKPGITRNELKAAFARYQETGQVAFVTFHQSFSYEDFVEGIRAESREDGALEYKVEPGIFAKLCEQAGRGVVAKDDPFEQAINLLQQQSEQIEDNLLEMVTTRGKVFKALYSGNRTFSIYPASNPELRNGYTANLDHVRTLYITGEKVGYNPSYVQGILDYLKSYCGLPEKYEAPSQNKRKPFVLIIDEINRGNVSRIFGELITLIETSKRAGASEAISTTLPYSKRPFSVPDNLYLIGTMNTADRSLAGLDIALRRRFVFEEMPPRPELLEDVVIESEGNYVNVGELLNVLNQRIEVLLDRNHCLGHAYFMPLRESAKPTLHQLGSIFKNQILPLLQEYFFEDWQRIAWVLNDHRKSDKQSMFLLEPPFNIEELLGNVPVGKQRQRWTFNPEAFSNIASYALTIKGDKGAQ